MDVKKFFENLSLNKGKKNIILIIGFLGILLIFLSNFLETDRNKNKETEQVIPTAENLVESYQSKLQSDLCDIVSNIDGVGNVRILITMESTVEDVYAVEKSVSEQSQSNSEESKVSEANDYSEDDTYVKVKNDDGSESLVMLKQVMPKIRGVLVVCEGGENSTIKEKVTQAVSGVLNISSSKVYVTN